MSRSERLAASTRPARTGRRTVTTGCGQGSVFGDLMAHIDDIVLPEGATKTIARNFVIANVAAPAGFVASE